MFSKYRSYFYYFLLLLIVVIVNIVSSHNMGYGHMFSKAVIILLGMFIALGILFQLIDKILGENLVSYVIKRIFGMIPILFIIITISFVLMHQAPGGPFDQEKKLPDIVKKNIDEKYGFNLPISQQFNKYLFRVMKGDLDNSYKYHDKPVIDIVFESFPISFKIGFLSIMIALIFGTAIGFIAALKQNTSIDYALMSFAILGISVPNMVLGPILAVAFGVYAGWFPVAGWGKPIHYVLPVTTLSLYYIAIIARIARGSMLEVIRQDYIQTAKSKGLSMWTIVTRHALRGAMLPVVSYVGPATAFVITGSLVVEQIFGIPGIGRYFVMGAIDRDYTLVMGTVILLSLLVLFFNLCVDIAYTFLDPRIKLHKEK